MSKMEVARANTSDLYRGATTKLKTATGKLFDCNYFNVGMQTREVSIRVQNSTLVEVATVFSSHSETQQMWWEKEYAAQYTRLIVIVPEGDAIRVVLGKE